MYSLMDIFQKLLQLPYDFNRAIEHYRARVRISAKTFNLFAGINTNLYFTFHIQITSKIKNYQHMHRKY